LAGTDQARPRQGRYSDRAQERHGRCGANIALREWFEQTPRGLPGTFDVVLTVSGRNGEAPTAALVADVIAEIDRTKPVRAHYTFTQGFSMQGTQRIAAAVRSALYRRLSFTDI